MVDEEHVDILWLHLEIVALSMMLIALHTLRPKLGPFPLIMTLGLCLPMMMIGGRLKLAAPSFGGSVPYGSQVYLALILGVIVLVYALEGTRDARRLILSLVVLNAILFLLRILIEVHVESAGGLELHGRERWVDLTWWPSLVSTVAMFLDGVAIIVVYQGLLNLSSRVPQELALSLALVVATVLDGLIYGGLSGSIAFEGFDAHVLGKLTAGIAASLPMALYIRYEFRRHPDLAQHGVLERGAFQIMDLRKELKNVKAELQSSQAQYQHVKEVFGRYVMPDVVDEILKDTSQLNLGGELREVTILFSDIRGYSTLSEHMDPEETIELLNEYFGAMSEIINAERGTIIEFEGDAILTVFGAPLTQLNHAERAVRTSIAMLEEVDRLNARWNEDGTSHHWREVGIPTFKIRIGLHSGDVVVGNVGSETRTKYAVIGDTVNTAHRVESLNKVLRTTLLLSSTTAERLSPEQREILVDLGEHAVKGRAEHVSVFTVEGLPRSSVSDIVAVEPK